MSHDSFSKKLDTWFSFSEESKPDRGEDNFCCAMHVKKGIAMVGVFDGCGGSGAQCYREAGNRTGAYLASRIVSGAVYDWFYDCAWGCGQNTEQMAAEIRNYIDTGMQVCEPYIKGDSRLAGAIVRKAPTTAAICVARNEENGVSLHVIWAGDSRVYLLDEDGLAQLTEDDVKTEDAFANLTGDGVLTNVIDAGRPYELHTRRVLIHKPTLVFSATDGCFGYIPSPMEFEGAILQEIIQSGSTEELKYRLKEVFRSVAEDDYTFSCMSFMFGSFERIRDIANERYTYLYEKYLRNIPSDRDVEEVMNLWKKYQQAYVRFCR